MADTRWNPLMSLFGDVFGPQQSPITGGPMYYPAGVSNPSPTVQPAPTTAAETMQNVMQQYNDPAMRGVGVNTVLGFTESPASMKVPEGHVLAYHGGPGTVDWAAANNRRGAIDQFNVGPEGAAFFSNVPQRAEEYAVARYPERAAVYPVHLDEASMLTHDQAQGWKSNKQLIEEAKAAGSKAVRIRNAQDTVTDGQAMGRINELLGRKPYGGAEDVFMVLDPTAIRYPFGK